MKRIITAALLAVFALGCYATAQAAMEVKMVGDARISANFRWNKNYTGWNTAGTQTEEPLDIWERFRLRTDFVANEALKFRLGIKVEDTWGHGGFTVDNSAVDIAVYQAFLQFKWPDTDVEITAGYQPITLPVSSIFNGSVVLDTDTAAIIISAPLIQDTLGLLVGYGRLLDTNQRYDPTTTQVPDELDAFVLALPITLDGFTIIPWSVLALAGNATNYTAPGVVDNLVSAGYLLNPAGFRETQAIYWWAGSAFEVTALDPIKFYADVIYGQGAMADRSKNSRWGWFVDAAVEYTGWDVLTPQLFGWWSTGEDGSTRNGSERMPNINTAWNCGNSFLFDGGQAFKDGFMGLNPIGSWGLGISLNDISFMENLTHRLTFAYARGTNSATALRDANMLLGYGNQLFSMGRDLTTNEYVLGANFDTQYMIYENLAAILETGWSHGEFETSVWSHRFTQQARDGDAWKVAFGLQYKF
jgi:opacity protein-like surface antigen